MLFIRDLCISAGNAVTTRLCAHHLPALITLTRCDAITERFHSPPVSRPPIRLVQAWRLRRLEARALLDGLSRTTSTCAPLAPESSSSTCGVSSRSVYTSSVRFRDEIERLCLHAGYSVQFDALASTSSSGTSSSSASINCSSETALADGLPRLRGSTPAAQPTPAASSAVPSPRVTWRVTYSDHESRSSPSFSRATEVRTVPYAGRTWCVTVPHGFIITRRAATDADGTVVAASSPVVAGNCKAGECVNTWGRERLRFGSVEPVFGSMFRISGLVV